MGKMSKKILNNRINNRKQRKLKAEFSKIKKPEIVDAELTGMDIIYYKQGFWAILQHYHQNIVVYNTRENKGALYYIADFLIFLKKRFKIKYCQCKGRIGKYDFFYKLYGQDFIKYGVRGGENVYFICISDNAIKTSRKIKCKINSTRLRNLRKRKKSGNE